jgi:hypothetical protein
MDLDIFKLGDGEPMSSSPSLGLQMQWLQQETKNMTEDEFWPWIVDLNNNGLNEEHLKSIEERRKINKHLVPRDFEIKLIICLSIIFLQSQESWMSRGLNPQPR